MTKKDGSLNFNDPETLRQLFGLVKPDYVPEPSEVARAEAIKAIINFNPAFCFDGQEDFYSFAVPHQKGLINFWTYEQIQALLTLGELSPSDELTPREYHPPTMVTLGDLLTWITQTANQAQVKFQGEAYFPPRPVGVSISTLLIKIPGLAQIIKACAEIPGLNNLIARGVQKVDLYESDEIDGRHTLAEIEAFLRTRGQDITTLEGIRDTMQALPGSSEESIKIDDQGDAVLRLWWDLA
jgi:hypothetical protein